LKAKEEEIARDESDLNKAIVAFGYGKDLFNSSTSLQRISVNLN